MIFVYFSFSRSLYCSQSDIRNPLSLRGSTPNNCSAVYQEGLVPLLIQASPTHCLLLLAIEAGDLLDSVKIKLDKSRIRHYEGTIDGERMKELGEISLRMIKIPLENESLEVLATNLSEIEFSTNEIKELYHMRWGIMPISA